MGFLVLDTFCNESIRLYILVRKDFPIFIGATSDEMPNAPIRHTTAKRIQSNRITAAS
jgi:hypothetical protein